MLSQQWIGGCKSSSALRLRRPCFVYFLYDEQTLREVFSLENQRVKSIASLVELTQLFLGHENYQENVLSPQFTFFQRTPLTLRFSSNRIIRCHVIKHANKTSPCLKEEERFAAMHKTQRIYLDEVNQRNEWIKLSTFLLQTGSVSWARIQNQESHSLFLILGTFTSYGE